MRYLILLLLFATPVSAQDVLARLSRLETAPVQPSVSDPLARLGVLEKAVAKMAQDSAAESAAIMTRYKADQENINARFQKIEDGQAAVLKAVNAQVQPSTLDAWGRGVPTTVVVPGAAPVMMVPAASSYSSGSSQRMGPVRRFLGRGAGACASGS